MQVKPIEPQIISPNGMVEPDHEVFVNIGAAVHEQWEENNVLKWVQKVDEHIDEGSLDIMKLGMRTELTETQREAAKSPSDLYFALGLHYDDPTLLLSRFIYALELLGHRRHGFRAVRKLDDFAIQKTTQFNPAHFVSEDKLKEFHFNQCLVKVCAHLEASYHSRLIAYFTRTHLGGTNPRMIHTPSKLIIKLLERQLITTTDQNALLEALVIVGAGKSTEYIYRYRHLNNLPEIGKELS